MTNATDLMADLRNGRAYPSGIGIADTVTHSQEARTMVCARYITVGEIALRAEGFPGVMRAAGLQMRRSGEVLSAAARDFARAARVPQP